MRLKSPVKYLSDEAYTRLPVWERALHQARSQVGVEEVPRGSNWGPQVSEYLKATGLNSPAYWCAAFVTWCYKQSKSIYILPKNKASTYYWFVFAKQSNILFKTPERGDLFVWNNDNGGHIGFVMEVKGDRFRTIEGNSNTDGSRNGYEVVERWRSVDELVRHKRWGFIRMGVQ